MRNKKNKEPREALQVMAEKKFKKELEQTVQLSDEEKQEKLNKDLYEQGRQYAEDGYPWEEVPYGLDNQIAFVLGYNTRLAELGQEPKR